MAKLSENVSKLVTALENDKSALTEMKVSVPENTKHSDIGGLIRTVEGVGGGGNVVIQINDEGYPEDTVFTARLSDGTEVSGGRNLYVPKGGEWTVTDSFSEYSDKVTVNTVFPIKHNLAKLIVTTDIGDGNVQTATLNGTNIKATVQNDTATFYLPKNGTWSIGSEDYEATFDIEITDRNKEYTGTYMKDGDFRFTLKLINASSHTTYYVFDAFNNNGSDMQWRWGDYLKDTIDNSSKNSTIVKEYVIPMSKWVYATNWLKYVFVSDQRYPKTSSTQKGYAEWTGAFGEVTQVRGETVVVDYSQLTTVYDYIVME